ncbi:Protein decapping 5 [Orchesella cincta]|uniref:Protein decapping 5 n=1 Tax=Orchesella cincta TaxID=48709 RepID=A0A1D2NE63_ORCCI|nr:Protein decapping 5 [Orchesella cincta]
MNYLNCCCLVFILSSFLLVVISASAISSQELKDPTTEEDLGSTISDTVSKRAWKNLGAAWGKRAWADMQDRGESVPTAIPDGAILKVPGGRERLGTNWIRHGESGLPIPIMADCVWSNGWLEATVQFLGKQVGVMTHSGYQYEGLLYQISDDAETISLSNVLGIETEGNNEPSGVMYNSLILRILDVYSIWSLEEEDQLHEASPPSGPGDENDDAGGSEVQE